MKCHHNWEIESHFSRSWVGKVKLGFNALTDSASKYRMGNSFVCSTTVNSKQELPSLTSAAFFSACSSFSWASFNDSEYLSSSSSTPFSFFCRPSSSSSSYTPCTQTEYISGLPKNSLKIAFIRNFKMVLNWNCWSSSCSMVLNKPFLFQYLQITWFGKIAIHCGKLTEEGEVRVTVWRYEAHSILSSCINWVNFMCHTSLVLVFLLA